MAPLHGPRAGKTRARRTVTEGSVVEAADTRLEDNDKFTVLFTKASESKSVAFGTASTPPASTWLPNGQQEP